MSDLAAEIDRIWTLVKDIPVAMVVTHDGQGWNMRAARWRRAPPKRKAPSIS